MYFPTDNIPHIVNGKQEAYTAHTMDPFFGGWGRGKHAISE